MTAAVRQDQADDSRERWVRDLWVSSSLGTGLTSGWCLAHSCESTLVTLGLSPDTGTSHSGPFHCSLPGQVRLHSEGTDLYLDAVGPDKLGLTQQLWLFHFKVRQDFVACEGISLTFLLDLDYIIIFFSWNPGLRVSVDQGWAQMMTDSVILVNFPVG